MAGALHSALSGRSCLPGQANRPDAALFAPVVASVTGLSAAGELAEANTAEARLDGGAIRTGLGQRDILALYRQVRSELTNNAL